MAIRHIQLSGIDDLVHETKKICKALPGLRYIDLFLEGVAMETDEKDNEQPSSFYAEQLEEPLVYDAKVILGDDSRHRIMERPERRDLAEKLEDMLSFKKRATGYESDDVDSVSSLGETSPTVDPSLYEFRRGIPPTAT